MSPPLNIYQNAESAKTAADVKVVAKQICYKFGQAVLCHSMCNNALLIVVPRGVESATNRKASRGSSEKLLMILQSSSWLLTAGYVWETKNQLGTVVACLLSANRGLFLVQSNTIK